MIIVVLVVVGLCLGSFVNALVWRLHEQAKLQEKRATGKLLTDKELERFNKLSLSKGRSMCLHCGRELAVKDLVPVFSWLSLRGKCRYCGKPIPDTPVAELLVPLLFVASYIWWPQTFGSFFSDAAFGLWLMCLVGFVALALYDLRWFLLPDRIVFPLTGVALLQLLASALALGHHWTILLPGEAWGVLVIAGLFYLLFALSDGKWIGGGDVKLGVSLGLLVGGPLNGLLVILGASIFGLLAAAPQLVRGKAGIGTKLPFGPFLLLATVIVMLVGSSLTDWYLGLLRV